MASSPLDSILDANLLCCNVHSTAGYNRLVRAPSFASRLSACYRSSAAGALHTAGAFVHLHVLLHRAAMSATAPVPAAFGIICGKTQ